MPKSKKKTKKDSVPAEDDSQRMNLAKAAGERTHVRPVPAQEDVVSKSGGVPRQQWEKTFKKMHDNGDDTLLIDDVFGDENFDG
jgi:antitoxin MazE